MTEETSGVPSAAVIPTSLPEAQRRRKGVRETLDRLERAVSAPATGREAEWVQGLTTCLVGLQTAFRYHVDVTEGPDGLLNDLAADAPRLARGAEQLRTDHVVIGKAIERVLAAVQSADAAQHVSIVSDAVLDVMARVTRHRHAGASLVYEAYTVDIEAAD